jgi:uncharacterized oxidoreductase
LIAETASLSLAAPALRELVDRVFRAAGTPDDIADVVATSLVESNIRGVDSHGFIRVPEYLEYIRDGRIEPAARPVISGAGPVLRVNGQRSFGQLAARESALAGAERARAHGVAIAILGGVKHVGRLGEYVELCAELRHLALAFANGGPRGGLVAPFGGRHRALGTNPLAYAFPVAGRAPVVADFSTSAAAEGKVRIYRDAGARLPDGWVVDAQGLPSQDPADLYAGGALLPAAGHKGYALGLLGEVLGGVLAGEGCACAGDDPGNGFVLLVVDAGEGFAGGAARAVTALESSPPTESFDGVVVPGSPELETARRRQAAGIPFSAETWRRFVAAARSVDVAIDDLEPAGKESADV